MARLQQPTSRYETVAGRVFAADRVEMRPLAQLPALSRFSPHRDVSVLVSMFQDRWQPLAAIQAEGRLLDFAANGLDFDPVLR